MVIQKIFSLFCIYEIFNIMCLIQGLFPIMIKIRNKEIA